ncbi:hypothetical protein GA0115251_10887 [Streptomyces sp. TverLS-915]|uniref:hypothetical protein n=1 Tax=Streptomyces sp. TverLS-915 TaxID=1839763 RepID=UPI00081F2E48|nr:hypothetical protein [Streptomyces sp. TverLS-915]SCD46858.1 hypothetical protein GA0115251_10887 [Streptomyces sp. TverLS-915]
MSETPEPMTSPSPQPLPGPVEAGTTGSAEEETNGPDEGQTSQDAPVAGETVVVSPTAGIEAVPAPAEAVAAPAEDVEAARLRRAKARLVFDDPLYGRGRDDSDRGWGDRPVPRGGSAADLARFLDEKPPHHI